MLYYTQQLYAIKKAKPLKVSNWYKALMALKFGRKNCINAGHRKLKFNLQNWRSSVINYYCCCCMDIQC